MQRSQDRFLITHTGSLPRPEDLIRMMYAKEEGVPVEPHALAERIRSAVAELVKKQANAGVDLINDGEMSKPSYATYVKDRLSGFGGSGNSFVFKDLVDFPKTAERVFANPGRKVRRTPACNGPIAVRDEASAKVDVANLKASAKAAELFVHRITNNAANAAQGLAAAGARENTDALTELAALKARIAILEARIAAGGQATPA